MATIELQCWVVLAASIVIMVAAVLGLVADRYIETLPENIALVLVALSGFVVSLQIAVRGVMQVSGIVFMAVAVAVYALVRLYKKWHELYREAGPTQWPWPPGESSTLPPLRNPPEGTER